jgi:ketosteroid isomerase-like protein
MYKATVRALIKRSIRHLNAGNYRPLLGMYANDAELVFPGDNFLSRQLRSPQEGRSASPTHRGKAELEAFLRRCVELGLQFQVEDILVNGPPWKTRVCVRDHHWILNDGEDAYANRAAICVVVAWGKIKREEIYQDTERVRAFEREFGPFEHASG